MKKKVFLYVNPTSQRCLNKKFKTFLIKDFSIRHWCQRHRWCTLSCQYPREISRKFETALMGYSWAWGRLIHEKPEAKYLVALSL
jgi:hypothetical protein